MLHCYFSHLWGWASGGRWGPSPCQAALTHRQCCSVPGTSTKNTHPRTHLSFDLSSSPSSLFCLPALFFFSLHINNKAFFRHLNIDAAMLFHVLSKFKPRWRLALTPLCWLRHRPAPQGQRRTSRSFHLDPSFFRLFFRSKKGIQTKCLLSSENAAATSVKMGCDVILSGR